MDIQDVLIGIMIGLVLISALFISFVDSDAKINAEFFCEGLNMRLESFENDSVYITEIRCIPEVTDFNGIYIKKRV